MASRSTKKIKIAERPAEKAQQAASALPYSILLAAARLFQKKGFANVSMREIADAVELSKAGLYHHCPSKEGLLTGITRLCGELLDQHLESVRNPEASPLSSLQTFVVTRMEVITTHQDLFTVFWQERPLLQGPTFSKLALAAERYRDGIRTIIQDAQKAGDIRKDVDSHLLMLAIDGMTGWACLWYRKSGDQTPQQIGRAFWSYLAKGIVP